MQVAVYDDRLEVTSPGGLYNGLTYEDMLKGHSRLRNRTIANIFNQMGLAEAWGTGIKRIISYAEMYGLPAPEIQAFDSMFRVNLYRSNSPMAEGGSFAKSGRKIGERSEKDRRKIGEGSEKQRYGLNTTQQEILKLLSRNARLSASKMAEQIGISRRNVEANIKMLKKQEILIRHGSPKSGYWEIMREEK